MHFFSVNVKWFLTINGNMVNFSFQSRKTLLFTVTWIFSFCSGGYSNFLLFMFNVTANILTRAHFLIKCSRLSDIQIALTLFWLSTSIQYQINFATLSRFWFRNKIFQPDSSVHMLTWHAATLTRSSRLNTHTHTRGERLRWSVLVLT